MDSIPVGAPIDLYAPSHFQEIAKLAKDTIVDIGKVELAAGDHQLSLSLVGNNENSKADPRGCFICYLDYFNLAPIQ